MPSFSSALRVPTVPPDIRQTTELVERIRDLRQEMGLGQAKFAERFGLPVAGLKNWESGRRSPDIAAAMLLELILLDPKVMLRLINRVLSQRQRLSVVWQQDLD